MRSKPLVCLVDSAIAPLWPEFDLERSVLGDKADLTMVFLDDPQNVPLEIIDSDALIVGHFPRMPCQVLQLLRAVRVIVRNGVGYDNVDVEAARELGIPVCNVPDYGTEEVADHALMLTLALQRRLSPALNDVRAGNWSWKVAIPVHRLRGQRFGVIGCGRIGTAVALRAKALGFRVQFYDPYVSSGYEKAVGVDRVATLSDLLQTSDVVSLHTPLTSETRGMIGAAEFALMKAGAFLVNTARGPVVQEKALIAALKGGKLGGAALDLVEREPAYDPELLNHSNCLITPHSAFYSEESLHEMRANAARTVLTVLDGGLPVNVVNGVPRSRAGRS